MAFVVGASAAHKYFVDVDVVDDPAAFDAFDGEHRTRGMAAGIEVPADIIPRNFIINGKRKPKHGFFSAVIGKAVDDRVKDAIEAREPGVHRFHPVNITMKSGEPLDRPHFLLNCCEQLDAIAPEHSEVKLKNPHPDIRPDLWYYTPLGTLEGLAVYKDRVKGRAMWWDNRLHKLFFSDDLSEALEKAGVEGFKQSPHVVEV